MTCADVAKHLKIVKEALDELATEMEDTTQQPGTEAREDGIQHPDDRS